jgi:hypothetical protein
MSKHLVKVEVEEVEEDGILNDKDNKLAKSKQTVEDVNKITSFFSDGKKKFVGILSKKKKKVDDTGGGNKKSKWEKTCGDDSDSSDISSFDDDDTQKDLKTSSEEGFSPTLKISDRQILKRSIINMANVVAHDSLSSVLVTSSPVSSISLPNDESSVQSTMSEMPSSVASSNAEMVLEKNSKLLIGSFSGVEDVLDLIVNKRILNEFCICFNDILKQINDGFIEMEECMTTLTMPTHLLSSSFFSTLLVRLQNLSVGVVSTTIPFILASPLLPLDVSSTSLFVSDAAGLFVTGLYFFIFYLFFLFIYLFIFFFCCCC